MNSRRQRPQQQFSTQLTVVALVAALATCVATVGAQAPSPGQPRPPQPFATYLQGQYAAVKRVIVASAEKMPAEHYGFRPSSDVRTYAELIGHIVGANFSYCNVVKGGQSPAAGRQFESIHDKATLVQEAKDAFAYCDEVYASLTDENVTAMITIGLAPRQRQIARANQLTSLIVHSNEHYGNLVTYMRLKGIVPPSSTPQ